MIGMEERGKTDRKHGRRNHETQKRIGAIGGVRRAVAGNGGRVAHSARRTREK